MEKGLWSVVAGFVAAVIFPTFVLSVSMAIGTGSLQAGLIAPVLFFPYALIGVVVLGIPTFLLLRPLAPAKWWMAVAAGLILGIPLRLILSLILPKTPLTDMLILEPLTALSTLAFWLVWRWAEERESACCAN
jgi:hypothetical protein